MSAEATYRVRRATLDDMPVFIEFRRRMFTEVGFPDLGDLDVVSEAYFARAIPCEEFAGFVAVAEWDSIVGSAGLSFYQMPPKPFEPSGCFGYVSSMYVLPDHRRRGVGEQMMEALIAHAESVGLAWLTLHASKMGRPLYESMGFEPCNEMRLHIASRAAIRPLVGEGAPSLSG